MPSSMKRGRLTEDLAAAHRNAKRPRVTTGLKMMSSKLSGKHPAVSSIPATPASSITLVGSPALKPASRVVSPSLTTSSSDSDKPISETGESDTVVDTTSASSSSSEDSESSDSGSTSSDSLPPAGLCTKAGPDVRGSSRSAHFDPTSSRIEAQPVDGGPDVLTRQNSNSTCRPISHDAFSSESGSSDTTSESGSESSSDGEASSSSNSASQSGQDSNSGVATGSASDGSTESQSDSESEPEADDKTPPFATPPPPYSLIDPHPSNLRSRLSSFLPSLIAANHTLEEERAAGTLGEHAIENVKSDDEQYIEMDLGLGVLEERRRDSNGNSSSDEGTDSESEPKETDVLGSLLGKHRNRERPYIEPLGGE